MKLKDIYKNPKKPVLTFEVFPPKTQEGLDNLVKEIERLKKFKPEFISVTYGAGGSTQGRSLQLLERIAKEDKIAVMPHLTCIGSSPESIQKFLDIIKGWGVESILALRGDIPQNIPDYVPESDYFQHASDLVKFTKENSSLDIAVAGFPEIHPEAKDQAEDLKYLKLKVEKGASTVFTQLFFNNDKYFKYLELARKIGVNVPIIPGIWTLTSQLQLKKIFECGAKVPAELLAKFEDPKYSDEDKRNIGVESAIAQVKALVKYGVPGIHLYTLNKAEYVSRVIKNAL